jgi:hypothetical protein
MTTQPDLFAPPTATAVLPPGVTEVDVANLRAHLMSHGWQTRREICEAMFWDERKLRDVAETLGPEIIRCQLGFKLTDLVTREDLAAVKQCVDAFRSQGQKMLNYSESLRRRLHAIIG